MAEELNNKEYYIELWRDYSVEAQIKLVKNEADANHATLIFYAIKDDLENLSISDLDKLDRDSSLLGNIFKRLHDLDFITDDNYRALTANPRVTRELGGRLKEIIGNKREFTPEDLIQFTKELFDNGYVKPVSQQISDEVAETYNQNLIAFRNRNANIENKLRELSTNYKEIVTKNEIELVGYNDQAIREEIKDYLDEFVRFRVKGGKVPNANRPIKQIINHAIPELEGVSQSQYKDPYNEKIESLNLKLQARRYREKHSKGDTNLLNKAIHNGPKPFESAIRKATEVYKEDFEEIKDVARIRNLFHKPNSAWVNNVFSQFFAEKNGFVHLENLSGCKGQKSGTAFSKTIYAIPVGDGTKYILGEVQNYNQIEHRIDKDISHELFEISRRMYDVKRDLSTDHLNLDDAKNIMESFINIFSKLEAGKYEYLEAQYSNTKSDKLVKFFNGLKGSTEIFSSVSKDYLGTVKTWTRTLNKVDGDTNINDLKSDDIDINNDSVSDLSNHLKVIAELCEKLHFAAVLIAKSNAPIEDRVLNHKLITRAFTKDSSFDKQGDILKYSNKELVDELLNGLENLKDKEVEKIYKDANRYIRHFNKGRYREKAHENEEEMGKANPNLGKYLYHENARIIELINKENQERA